MVEEDAAASIGTGGLSTERFEDAELAPPVKRRRKKHGEKPPADKCPACWYENPTGMPGAKLSNPRVAHNRKPGCRLAPKPPSPSSRSSSVAAMGSDSD